jgi:hypothetical protein
MTALRAQCDRLAVVIHQGKVRRFRSNVYTHEEFSVSEVRP